jgi:hypothetical protein
MNKFIRLIILSIIFSANINAQELSKEKIAIVSTHVSAFWDVNFVSFKAAKTIENLALIHKMSFINLVSPDDDSGSIYSNELISDQISHAGEFVLDNRFKTVVIFGGYPGACLANSMRDTLSTFLNQPDNNNVVYIITDAVFGTTSLSKIFPKATKKLERKGYYNYTLDDVLEISRHKSSRTLKENLQNYLFYKSFDEKDYRELFNNFKISISYNGFAFDVQNSTPSRKKLSVYFIKSTSFAKMLQSETLQGTEH